MDIEKLETLSCLKIDDSQKEQLKKDLSGVIEMMESLGKLEVSTNLSNKELGKSILSEDVINTNTVLKAEKPTGLHLEDGYFLAPKVIKK